MDIAELEQRLAWRAFLHDDPDAYLAGVQDTIGILADGVTDTRAAQDAPHARGA